MLITHDNLKNLGIGWTAVYNEAFKGAESHYAEVAMLTNSSTAEQVYPWLGSIPKLREWLGSRIVHGLEVHGFTIKNRKFEDTIAIRREDIEDDQAGVYTPMFQELGREAAMQPDRLVFELLQLGFTAKCYDGQYFFDTDHGVANEIGEIVSVSNMQTGAGPAWYLLDTSRAIRPLIYQRRVEPTITRLDNESDPNVFWKDEYVYGVRMRANAGFGLWQLAYASKADLTPENYEAARAAMTSLRGDRGTILGVKPTVLVVPMALEGAGRRILKAATKTAGGSNEWVDSAKLIATPWVG